MSNRGLRTCDFVFGDRRRIALIVPCVTMRLPSANTGNGRHAVNLHDPAAKASLHIGDIHVPRELIAKIAHAVGDRVLCTDELSDYYQNAAKLFDEEWRFIYANGLFDGSTDSTRLTFRRILEEIMRTEYPEGSPWIDEVAQVAYLAIFSTYRPE